MVPDNTCPICGFHLVLTEAVKCPQCDADLVCFTVLDSIPDEMPVSEDGGLRSEVGRQRSEDRGRRSVVRRPFLSVVFFLLGGLTSGLFLSVIHPPEPSSPVFLRTRPIGIKMPVKAPFHDGASDGKDTSAGMPKVEIFTDYEATGDETLWRISKKCYGSGFYFPVLMELNSGLGVYNLEKGARLKIFRNAGRAEQFYHKIIRVAGKRVWYGYRVVKGDSFEGIAKKFYGPKGTTQRIMAENPHATLQPGERIEVELR